MTLSVVPFTRTGDVPAPQATRPQGVLYDYVKNPACKRLINRIHRAQKEDSLTSIAVLSRLPSEEKTLAISVIALGFMNMLEQRVLIMDTVAQTRDESFYYGGVLGKPALAASGKESARPCIDLITSVHISRRKLHKRVNGPGKDRQAETATPLFDDNEQFDHADFHVGPFVDSMKEFYDLILLDTCPLTTVSKETFDPMILAQYTDASILVASQASLERETMSKTLKELRLDGITPMGIIVDSEFT